MCCDGVGRKTFLYTNRRGEEGFICTKRGGWSGGAAPGKFPVPGRPNNLDKSRARAYCA